MRALVVVVMMLTCGCVTTRDYGSGACTEYKPFLCLEGNMVCERDTRGCEVCSCQQNGVSAHPRRPPP